MTFVMESHTTENYYIVLENELCSYGSVYVVRAYPRENENLYGYPEKEMFYSMNELGKAEATFERYCKKYF